jgi:seryl-tRNA synthetase
MLVFIRVADVNQALVDDGLVEKEKIGGSNYFWSFPAKKDCGMQIQHQQNLESIEKLQAAIQEASARLADAKRGREDDDGDRPKKLQRLTEMAKERQTLDQELETLKENDPQALADLEKERKLVVEAANRWTDNVFNCKTYLTKKRGMGRKETDKLLGITSTFDCKYYGCGVEWMEPKTRGALIRDSF